MGKRKVYFDDNGVLHYNVDHSTAKEAMKEVEEIRRIMKLEKKYTGKNSDKNEKE